MKSPILKVRNLCVSFEGKQGVDRVVDGVSFDLFAGEIVGLVGESGCGKTVSAKALMGLLPLQKTNTTFSSLQLEGSELSLLKEPAWQRIRGNDMAMIFQEPSTALDPVFTIGDQISTVLKRHAKISRSAAREQSLEALKQGGFNEAQQVYDAYPHQLSGGMRQLAMIALAMATRPRVLIADEPTTSLDVSTQSMLIEQLKKLRDRFDTAILLVTHDLGVVAQCCQRVMVMYCGKLVEQAEYTELFSQPRHPYSKGLLDSVPRITAQSGQYAQAIPGRVPNPSEYSQGCHFAARCSRSDSVCQEKFPETSFQGSTQVACHHPLESK